RRDVKQQQSQLGNIPLAIAESIKGATANILSGHTESLIERAVRSHNMQVLIEDKQRIVDCVYDCLGERTRFVDVLDRKPVDPPWIVRTLRISIDRRFHVWPHPCPPAKRDDDSVRVRPQTE